jgi:uncharacterized protein HemX
MIGLYVCIALALACVLAKWQATYRVKRLQAEVDLLELDKEKLTAQLRELKDFYAELEIEQEQLTVECRNSSQNLQRTQASIEELEEVEKKIAEHRHEDPI